MSRWLSLLELAFFPRDVPEEEEEDCPRCEDDDLVSSADGWERGGGVLACGSETGGVRNNRNLSNQDIIGPDLSVLNSEVSLIQELLSTQMWLLGQMKVSCL